MNKLLAIIGKVVEVCIRGNLIWIADWVVQVNNAAPTCCKQKAEFTGSHTSLYQESLFYQCPRCLKVFVVTNPHKGLSPKQVWRLIFTNSSGEIQNANPNKK